MKKQYRRTLVAETICIVAVLAALCGIVSPGAVAQDEAALIAVIESDTATWQDKLDACRGLQQIGTPAAVPALAALLGDERLSHMARFALEPMPYPEVDRVLRAALDTTQGMPKVGLIISLGARRDAEAAPLIIPLLRDGNPEIAAAAIGALGRIATPEAVDALTASYDGAAPRTQQAVCDALLAAVQQVLSDGDGARAARMSADLLAPRWPVHVRMGAFAALVEADPAAAPRRLIEALRGEEPLFRDLAAQLIVDSSEQGDIRVYAETLPTLPVGGQVALLRALADVGDASARPQAVQAARSADAGVKEAAVTALASLGNAADVPLLAEMVVAQDAGLAEAAKATLVALQGDGVNAAIAAAASGAAPATRVQLLDVMASRRSEQAAPLAVASLSDADASVRIAGFGVLALLGRGPEAGAVVGALVKAADGDELSAAENALTQICRRAGDEALPVVLEGMASAGPEPRVSLLRAAALIGGPQALETVVATLDDADEDVRGEAVRTLSGWATADAAPHLLELARSDDLSRHVLSMQGYVRLAAAEPSVDAKARMLSAATDLVRRPEEKKLVLGAWAAVPTAQSLGVLRAGLDDADVRNEAAIAINAVAAEVGKSAEHKALAVEALRAVVEKCEDEGVRANASKALEALQ